MKKKVLPLILLCGTCFMLCSCGKDATTFTTEDIDTFVDAVGGITSDTTDDSDDSDWYDSDTTSDSENDTDEYDIFGVEPNRESDDLAAVDSVASAFIVAIANSGPDAPDMDDVTWEEMDSDVLQETEKSLGKSIQEVESAFESRACAGKQIHFQYCYSENKIIVAVGSLEGTPNRNGEMSFYYSSGED